MKQNCISLKMEVIEMFTLVELFQSFIIAIVFIFLFKLHRELFPHGYFVTGDILSEIEYAPTKNQ